MKIKIMMTVMTIVLVFSQKLMAQNNSKSTVKTTGNSLYIDVHDLEPGSVTYADVLAAHKKDLATQGKYGVTFIKFWVDPQEGKIYCLSSAPDTEAIIETHRQAHGLLPAKIYKVTEGSQSSAVPGEQYFLDVHHLGAGNVTAAGVAAAHQKDLKVEKKYGVNFINYWVDTDNGTIFCLSQAPDSNAIIQTHREAHGLLPAFVLPVEQGQ